MEDQDFDIEDILESNTKKKRINSKRKGKRVELELCKVLSKHFKKQFSRSVGSGNRWGQVTNLPKHARDTFTGDICPPEGFKWVIECKGGYENDIDLNGVLDGGCARLDDFIKQSERDAKQSGRLPIIIWKRSRKPWLAMLLQKDLDNKRKFKYRFYYREWVIVPLMEMLEGFKEDFWFHNH